MKNQPTIQTRFEQKVIYAILLIGVVLALTQFVFNRSLWFDEAMLALNIINRNSLELLQTLDYNQVAPILFLQLEKLFSLIIPNSEFGLRLLPLLCFLFSLFFFYKILQIIFKDYISICFALSMFVFNSFLIYFSSEVKQYMVDVFVMTSLYYISLKSYKTEATKYYLLALAGIICIFSSNVTPLILFSIGTYLLYDYFINKKGSFKHLSFIAVVWLICFSLYFFNFIHEHPTKNYMISYWSDLGAFMPSNPLKIEFYQFLKEKFKPIFESLMPLRIDFIRISVFFFLMGCIALLKKNKPIFILTLTPLFLHLFLSGLWLYPFDLRLVLYTFPLLIIITTYGFDFLINFEFHGYKIQRFKILIVIIPLYFLFIFLKKDFPYEREELKKSIRYIQKNKNENDNLYVFYGALEAFSYYDDIQLFNINQVKKGSKNRKNWEKYISEIQALNGRNWLLYSHDILGEGNYINEQLDSLGYEKIDSFKTIGSSTFLFDLKEKE